MPAPAQSTTQAASDSVATPAASAPATTAMLDAQLGEMTRRMAAATGFDAKNKVFHEYFDAVPESDTATRTAFFGTFMSNIPKADADRVIAFLKGLEAKESAAPAATAPTAATAPRRASSAPDGVLMIGDSLSVGTDPHFGDEQTGVPTQVNAKSGRSLSQGMDIYNATAVKPRVVEMALFTNNTPGQIESLRHAVQQTIEDARSRGGRVVWATIVGNPKLGSYDAVNAMLREFATKNADVMGLVDWAKMTKDNPSFLAGDGYHGTTAGYKARAQAFADAARA